jgi:beta-1,4-N-acetylglucosaminyltransferase
MSGQFRTIFVTVGTTEFKELFESIDKSSFVDAIAQLGCRRLNIQVGRGDFPVRIPVECQLRGIDYDCFQFKPNLNTDMIGADLIISHCGAGSILEVRYQHPTFKRGNPINI